MELSKRLQAVADLLSEGMRVADIGCDHGFLSIYLVESGKSPACIALDVNKGPLERAREHIDRQRLSTYIETRLSNGACGLRFTETEKNRRLEVEAAVLAGMGGKLMIRLVEESLDKFSKKLFKTSGNGVSAARSLTIFVLFSIYKLIFLFYIISYFKDI